MHGMDELKETLYRELDKIAKKGDINEADLAHVDKLTHSIKSIDTILAMEGYSEGIDYRHEGSYATRRDRYGRYSRDEYTEDRRGRDADNDGRYYERSRDAEKDRMIDMLEDKMRNAVGKTERDTIQRCIETIEQA